MYICYNILWYNNSKKVEDNMIEKILAYILACCNNSEFEQTIVALISENLKISRSQVSVVLNKLVKENKLIRIESKPFCFISVEYLKEKSIPFKDSVYASLDDLLSNQEKKDFEKLVDVIRVLEVKREISVQEVMEITQKSRTTAWRYMKTLVELGVVEAEGNTNNMTYRIR